MHVRLSQITASCALLMSLSALQMGCGHNEDEWQEKIHENERLQAELATSRQALAADQERFTQNQAELEAMRAQLRFAGVGLEKSQEETKKLMSALEDARKRSEQLAAIEARFRELRTKLERLTQIGLKVVVRNNRMVIQLPGDILFESGKADLKAEGRDALRQVADVIRADKELSSRAFQVAGHTDNAPYGSGPFKDNWGLSLNRARTVLLYLIAPVGAKDSKTGGGGLDSSKLAAAGYGETDPLAGTVATQSKDEQQKNRRVELVVQPNVSEMLDLNNIK